MVNGAKSRVRGYFYGARKLVKQSVPPATYTTVFEPIFNKFLSALQKDDFFGGLFGRKAPRTSVCVTKTAGSVVKDHSTLPSVSSTI